MAMSIYGGTLTQAWLADLEYLHCYGREELNLVTTIGDPDPARVDMRVIKELDEQLVRKRKQRVGTVANTIFPVAYGRGCLDRQQFYERYLKSLPRLRMHNGNGRGTYFGRLIEYPISADVKRGLTANQLEGIIRKLQAQLRGGAPKRFAYQAQVFIPGRDDNQSMGFPCLSFISFQLDRDRLCLTAMYRNQFYIERALGNFIGLARLQRFVAEECGLMLGSLTVHACHAEIDLLGKRAVEQLIGSCTGTAPSIIAA